MRSPLFDPAWGHDEVLLIRILEQIPALSVKRRRNVRPRPAPVLSAAKRRMFYGITILFPFLLLLLLEVGLRLFSYGPDLSLFTTEVVNGRVYHIMNPGVKSRYFSHVDFSPSTSPDYFLVPKSSGTFRIFCLGGSTTVGYPYWYNGSFSSFLRDRLRAVFPGRNIEVINCGMTATNSFTVLDVARDLVGYEPDLFVVYDGHNEFYGALGVASHESAGISRWLTSLYLRAIHWKTFLLLRDAYTRVGSFFAPRQKEPEAGTMMERLARGQYVPIGSPTYAEGLEVFRGNLAGLRDICMTNGIPLILGTQVSNLRDRPPFVSGKAPGATPQEQLAFNASFNRARALELDNRADSALAIYRDLALRDPLWAETAYRIGRCLDTLGRKQEAYDAYVKARDYDQLRFRTSSEFNAAIKALDDGGKVIVADMEAFFRGASPDSLIGNGLITEHLHPNSYGYFLLAKAYAAAMRARGFLDTPAEWARRDTVSDERLWEDRKVTELDERTARRRTEVLTSGWPFQSQYPVVDAIAADDTLGQMAENLSRARWNWLRAHESAAEYYERRGEFGKAEREYQVIISQIPQDGKTYLRLARLYLDRGKLEEMRGVLIASLAVEKTILAYRALGDLAMQQERPSEAISYYEKTLAFPQNSSEQVENGYLLGLAYYRAGMGDKASVQMLRVLKVRPDFQPAIEILAKVNSSSR